MEQIDTLITARWVVPIEPANETFERSAVAIHQGRILAVLPEGEARARYVARETLERPTHVLIPGLVNAHTSAAMTLLRGLAESGSVAGWRRDVEPIERRWIDADYVRTGTELAIAEMLAGGATCFADVHLFPEVVARTASEARMRACVGLPVVQSPIAWADSADECLAKGLALHDEYREDPLVTTALAPLDPGGLDDATLVRVRRIADELELPVTMHVNETRGDAASGGERTIARLDRLGLLSPLLAAVHFVHFDEDDLDRFVRAGASVVHCPQSNLKLGAGVCRASALAAAGVNVALGAGSAASNNDLDMFDEMRTAALLARGVHVGGGEMSAHAWLRAATLNGARALGLSEVTGSLVPGKWADICCVDLQRARTQPVHDVAAQLVFAAAANQVTDVWVAGRGLVRDGRLTQMDVAAIMARAALWGARIAGREHS
jgi:5-methylthioadenosine/S-adenosylhomocysteine deaminase